MTVTDVSTTCAVENVLTVNNNSPIHDYVHLDHHTQPTGNYEMTPRFKPFAKKKSIEKAILGIASTPPLRRPRAEECKILASPLSSVNFGLA